MSVSKYGVVGAALIPGLPHLLSATKSPAWESLVLATQNLAKQIAEAKPEALMIYSTQWMSVLGTSFQTQERPRGIHVDENWHEWGDLAFDFHSDVPLSKECAAEVTHQGFPTKLINYEEFPIDTGTIVAMRLLNGTQKLPVSIVSSWVYADGEKTALIGRAMAKVAATLGKRVFAIGVSSLSQRYFTNEIDPATDRIATAEDDQNNRKLLGVLEGAGLTAACALLPELSKKMPMDMGGKALDWLRGVCGEGQHQGRVLAYGPIWGTGNAVVSFSGEQK